MRLNEILAEMDIPEIRKKTDDPANLRWLLRNLHVRNGHRKEFTEAIALLKVELGSQFGE